jgi:hypothetical protein
MKMPLESCKIAVYMNDELIKSHTPINYKMCQETYLIRNGKFKNLT